ncbi:hypothetical protein DFQ30_004432 [Apophysomyces sp. BC1015]|nr:hypothetical protein DFQ30_004432 [Apophysomyces sp. BC1015]KAG0178380.1 hypothetical protein DFQ29_003526 [Apophysomyces sp. BC1021]
METQLLEQTAQQTGYNNGVFLSISGANSFKTKLENSLANRNEQQSATVTDNLKYLDKIKENSLYLEFDVSKKKIATPVMNTDLLNFICSGECFNSKSTRMKQELYDSDHVFGFKVDFRFILDASGIEHDIGAGEAARNNESEKLHKGLGKLLREGKVTVLDEEPVCKSGAWIIQILCLHAEISSVHLARDGLYVCAPQGKLLFLSRISNLHDFINDLEKIFLMVTKLEDNALALEENIDFLKNRRRLIGKYSPSRNDQHLSKNSCALFGDIPVQQSNSTETISSTDSNIITGISGDNGNDSVKVDPRKPDEYGWTQMDDGQCN